MGNIGRGALTIIYGTNTALPPTGLMCELLEYPDRTRIGNPSPRFGWIVRDGATNAHQVAYQVLVASSLEHLARDVGDMWDSGRPRPGEEWQAVSDSINVRYAGEALSSDATYHWKVRTWNQRNQASCWSEAQTFRTGALRDDHATVGYPIEQQSIRPVEVVAVGAGHTFIDFGRAAFGTMELTLACEESGTVDVVLGEVLGGPHTIHRSPGGSRRCRKIQLAVQPGTHSYRLTIPPDPRNTATACADGQAGAILMPDDVGEVTPFRYAEIIGTGAPVVRGQVRQVAATYPFNDTAARFVSSDPVLNDVWSMCHWTMKATSFCGLYVDGDRERIPYEADAYINQLGHYGCDREFTLARRTHEYLMTHPTWPTEWILFSVLLAWADFEYTGDASSLEAFYGDLEAKTLCGLAREDGLIGVDREISAELLAAIHLPPESPLRNIVDWPESERDGYEMVPINTAVNAFHYRARVLMGRIAAALGKAADAGKYAARADRAREACLARLVDGSRGLFVDGEGSRHCSLHANMFPLAFGLVPDSLRSTVVAFIRGKGMACSVYGAQFLLDGLYAAREADTALALLTSRLERSWAHMVHDVGTTIALEAWDDRFKPNQDWNHAWGAAPANVIPRRLMGVRPLEPGFGRILVEPQPGPLAFAEMTLPTIRGPVTVSVTNEPDRSFRLEMEVPANTTARVVLPNPDPSRPTIVFDGHSTRAVAQGDRLIIDPVGSGRHSFVRP